MYELMGKYGLDIFLGGTMLLTPRLFEQEIACSKGKANLPLAKGRNLT